jgi:hypothetical protein
LDETRDIPSSRTVDVPTDSKTEMAAHVDSVRRVVGKFCLEIVDHP